MGDESDLPCLQYKALEIRFSFEVVRLSLPAATAAKRHYIARPSPNIKLEAHAARPKQYARKNSRAPKSENAAALQP